jgi:predicted site-specific integrase-resolvase
MFGVQDATVTRWCAEGVLPPIVEMGRLRFISRDAVDQLHTNTVTVSSDGTGAA